MKTILEITLVLGLLLSALNLRAQPAPADAALDARADAADVEFETLRNERPPRPPKEMGAGKFLTWRDAQYQRITAAGLGFYAAHPADPRRWDVLLAMAVRPPLFARPFGPDVEQQGQGAALLDEPAKAEWEMMLADLEQALMDSTDASVRHREAVEWRRFAKDFGVQTAARKRGDSFDYGPFRARFDAHITKYAELNIVGLRATDYLGALEKITPGSREEIWRQLLATPNEKLREAAAARIRFLDLTSKPLEVAFTAVDGRAVDLKNLRGKVVLIDFWATWCGPCKAELPNAVANYKKYHDRGFEVIGVALENAKLAPKDTAEQTAAKLEKAKKVLTDFTANERLPGPQYFDGKYWKSDCAVHYGITAIPAIFLLDQNGMIVATDARGEKLEAEVKKLLKL